MPVRRLMVCPQKACGIRGAICRYRGCFLDSAIAALGVEEFGDKFEIHGVVVTEVLQDGPGVGVNDHHAFGMYFTRAFMASPGRALMG